MTNRLVATVVLGAVLLVLAVASPAAAQPSFATAPDDYSTDATPSWTFVGESGTSFTCTLLRPFEGMWDGGPTGEDPPPSPELIDRRDCSSGVYIFDLGSERDALYTLQLTETDTTGGISTAEDSFRLDRVAYTPIIRTGPDDVSNDPTPAWTFYYWGETAPRFDCQLVRAGSSVPVYQGACSVETFTADLKQFPDDEYTLSVTLTDQAGNTSDPATDTFVLDRTIPNAPPTASFTVRCFLRSCDFDGTASGDADGTIESYSWSFGDGTGMTFDGNYKTADHTYNGPGSYTVTLTVTDNAGATGSESRTVAIDPPNAPPIAGFTLTCSGVSCSFDGGASADSDGAIKTYSWSFGDGTTGSGASVQHAFAQSGTYTVTLSVTDDDGAVGSESKPVSPIRLTASGYKVKGLRTVDLAWTGSSAAGFDVYRNGVKIATVQTNAYTDDMNQGPGGYVFKVCAVASSVCSNETTVSF